MSALGKDKSALFSFYLFEKKEFLDLQCKIAGVPIRCLPAVPLLAFVAQICKQRSLCFFFGWWLET